MFLQPEQFIDRQIVASRGVWEAPLRRFMIEFVRSGEVFIDIGAHKGYLTCLAAQLVGPTGKVISFEPDPRAFSALETNLKRNSFSNVNAFQVALGAEPGTIPLSLTKTLGNTSSFPNRIAIQEIEETIEVSCVRLDDVLAEFVHRSDPSITLIKMDAEGAEPLIWAGMQRIIATHRPIVALEINYASLLAAGQSVSSFKSALAASGYHHFYEYDESIRGLRIRKTDIERERELLVDVLAVPSGHQRFARLLSDGRLRVSEAA